MPPRTASSSSKKSGKARASSAEMRETAIANTLAVIAQEPLGDTAAFLEYAATAVQALDTLESLGADRQLVREQEDRAAEFLGDYVDSRADEEEFRHPRLLRGQMRNTAAVYAKIAQAQQEEAAAKQVEAVAKAEGAAAKPESSSSAGKPARRSVRLHVPEPIIELDDDNDELAAKTTAVTGKRKTRSSAAKADALPAEAASTPRAKKAKPGELPVFSPPTYTGKSTPRLPPSGQQCDYCAAYTAKVKCIVHAGLDSCDRCALQFHSCKGTKASGGDTERYTDWYDANGFDRADRPDAAEVRRVFHDRQRPAAVPLWARKGGPGGAAPSSSSSRVPSTGSRPSGLRGSNRAGGSSSASASRRVEVIVPPAPAKPRAPSPAPVEGLDDNDVEMVDNSSPRTPPPRSPSPPSSAPSVRRSRPARPSRPPLPPADSPSNPVGRKASLSSAAAASSSQVAPCLDLANLSLASLVHVAPVNRVQYWSISSQMDILESQRWVIEQQLEQLRRMWDELTEGDAQVPAEDDEDAEGEEDEEAGPSA
ncbi:hypothetical protein BV20DRAFT_1050633 [Pilatotrama ljubarskyi]|nr:hypothetical protein BV20DRAFT_1050633 [Pilatotrama ljubarskyi]